MNTRLPRSLVVFVVMCLLWATGVLYTWYCYSTRVSVQNRARNVRSVLQKLKRYPSREELRKDQSKSQLKEPLTYLENTLQSQNISELTPTGETEQGNRLFRIRLEAVPANDGVTSLHTIETEGHFNVKRFRLERIGARETTFDVTLNLVVLGP
ncbi:MAG: hypothetical protein ABEJ65_12510 [bacterium]